MAKKTTTKNPSIFDTIIEAINTDKRYSTPPTDRMENFLGRMLAQVNFQLNGVDEKTEAHSYRAFVKNGEIKMAEHYKNSPNVETTEELLQNDHIARDAYMLHVNRTIADGLDQLYQALDASYHALTGKNWQYDHDFVNKKRDKIVSSQIAAEVAKWRDQAGSGDTEQTATVN